MASRKSTKRVAIYARVSTDGQSTENQLQELRQVANRAGWTVVHEYVDRGVSGSRGRDKRPQFDALCKASTRRECDVVVAWSVDRLGRSLQHLVSFLGELHSTDTDLYLHQQGIDTTTPAGKAMFQMCGVFAEFERSMIRERVTAGLARAKANGKKLGRPKVSPSIEQEILRERKNGTGMLRIAKKVGVGTSTVQRVIASAEESVNAVR